MRTFPRSRVPDQVGMLFFVVMIKRVRWAVYATALLWLPSCNLMEKPLIIGHRGAKGHVTENTLASIEKAIELGVDAVEIDVYKIKTGEIVVFHDDTVDRLTDGTGKIEEYSRSQLAGLLLEGNHKIPELSNVLDLIDGRVRLNIELKGAGTALDVSMMINSYVKDTRWRKGDFLISSFNWDELRDMRRLDSDIPIAILTGKDPRKGIAVAHELRAEAINPNFKTVDQYIVDQMHKAGFKVYVWTVNEPKDIAKMKKLGVDGIITDYPDRVE